MTRIPALPREETFFRYPPERVDGPLPFRMSAERAAFFDRVGQLAVLDVGCGRAHLRSWFERMGHRYTGVDMNPSGDVAGDCETLPFRDGSFDAIVTVSCLQFVPHPHVALLEMSRVLRPHGTITGTVAFLEPWTWGGVVHLTPAGLVLLLREAGFSVRYVWPGWSVDEAVRAARLRKLRNAVRALRCLSAGRATRRRANVLNGAILQRLEFAATLNFHAVKDRGR